MKMRGVYTVEAVFVVSICVWVLVAICLGGMYAHDRVVLESVTNEEGAAWLSQPDTVSEKEWTDGLREKLDGQLYLFRIRGVTTKSVLSGRQIRVRYTVAISWKFLKGIWMNGKSEVAFETVREDVEPAIYMWDASVLYH